MLVARSPFRPIVHGIWIFFFVALALRPMIPSEIQAAQAKDEAKPERSNQEPVAKLLKEIIRK
jgi:Na+/H+-dicarboxylate symporter